MVKHLRFFTPNLLKGAIAPNLIQVPLRLKSPLGDLGVNQKEILHSYHLNRSEN